MLTRHLKLWTSLFITALFLTACATNPFSKENTTYDRIKESNKIVVGMTGEQPPFNLFVEGNGTIGIDVVIANSVAKHLNADVEISIMKFELLQAALENGDIDMIISSFSVSEKRKEELLFSPPYMEIGKSLLTTKSKLKKIIDTTGFDDKSIRLVALDKSTSIDLAKERMPQATITPVAHYEQALIMIRADETDALICDITLCELAMLRNPQMDLTVLPTPLAVEGIAVAVDKNEPELNAAISEHIKQLKNTGQLKEIRKAWFENLRWIYLLP